jgi:hypothetical protein
MIQIPSLILLIIIIFLTPEAQVKAQAGLKDPQAVSDKEVFLNKASDGLPRASMAEGLGLESLPIPSEKDIFEGFGAYFDKASKKYVFRSSDLDSAPAKYFLMSLFPIPGVSPEQMHGLVNSAPCGRRGLETIVSYRRQTPEDKNSKSHQRVGLIWSCSKGCLGAIERTISDAAGVKKVVAMSPIVGIPEEFCSSIWGGIIRVDDKTTEGFIQ